MQTKEQIIDQLDTCMRSPLHNYYLSDEESEQAWMLFDQYCEAGGSHNDLVKIGPGRERPLWIPMLIGEEQRIEKRDIALKEEAVRKALERIEAISPVTYDSHPNGLMGAYQVANAFSAPVTSLMFLTEKPKNPWCVLAAVNSVGIEGEWEATLALLKKILDFGGDPNMADKKGYESPLSAACDLSLVKTTEMLVDYGADVNWKDCYGATPIMHCIGDVLNFRQTVMGRYRSVEISEILLKNGAHVNAITRQNATFHSLLKRYCSDKEIESILASVRKYLGEEFVKPPKVEKVKKRDFGLLMPEDVIENLRNDEKFLSMTKRQKIKHIVKSIRKTKIAEFEAEHIGVIFAALKIPNLYGVKHQLCPRSEATRCLDKMSLAKSNKLEKDGDVYRFV